MRPLLGCHPGPHTQHGFVRSRAVCCVLRDACSTSTTAAEPFCALFSGDKRRCPRPSALVLPREVSVAIVSLTSSLSPTPPHAKKNKEQDSRTNRRFVGIPHISRTSGRFWDLNSARPAAQNYPSPFNDPNPCQDSRPKQKSEPHPSLHTGTT